MDPAAVIAVLGSTIGGLVSVVVYFYKKHEADDARREAERDKREAQLIAERDAWQHRWESADSRLDRIAGQWLTAFRTPAPE